jgi:hypothetical protein
LTRIREGNPLRRESHRPTPAEKWPALDYAADQGTLDALHLQTQVVGKVKLALTRTAPEWQNVPLYVNARGLTTGLLQAGSTALEIVVDLVNHHLDIISTTDGRREGFELTARPLRAFTAEVMAALGRLKVQVAINPMTVEVPNPVRCDEYEGCDVYDRSVAHRLSLILAHTSTVFEDFRADFWGKQGPVSFFGGTFDLAVARYNLVPIPPLRTWGPFTAWRWTRSCTKSCSGPGTRSICAPRILRLRFPEAARH